MCVCGACMPSDAQHRAHHPHPFEKASRGGGREHRERTNGIRDWLCEYCAILVLFEKTILLCKVYTGSFHSCIIAARVPITQCAKHDKHGNERWSPHQTFVHLLHCMPVDAGQLAAGVAAGDTFSVRDLVTRLVSLEENDSKREGALETLRLEQRMLLRKLEALELKNTRLEAQLGEVKGELLEAKQAAVSCQRQVESFTMPKAVDVSDKVESSSRTPAQVPPSAANIRAAPSARSSGRVEKEELTYEQRLDRELAAGRTLASIRTMGFVEGLKAAGVTAREAKAGGYTAAEMRKAGFSCAETKDAGIWKLKDAAAAGYSLWEICQAGYECKDAKAAGYSLRECRTAGYVEGLKEAGFLEGLKEAGVTCSEAKRAGYVAGLKAAGFSCLEAKEAGYSCGAVKMAGFSLEEAKAAGFNPQECSRGGFTHKEAAACGYRYTTRHWNEIALPSAPPVTEW